MAEKYHCAIIGGGLAGLCLSIQLAQKGFKVVLFEKNQYPFQKVCGEYISMESWDFLIRLGVPLEDLSLPIISQLGVSSERGFMLNHALKMGGFGISRFSLDHLLSQLARKHGVQLLENCKVSDCTSETDDSWRVQTTQGTFTADFVCGSYGRYTPSFVHQDLVYEKHPEKDNYIGVKYHIKTDLPPDRIELHNFRDGYCGISKVDQDWYCLCYLTTARNLLENGKDIRAMEQNVLYRNPFLKRYFTQSEFVDNAPLVISNVQFGKKATAASGILLLGDAAGSITPLCGNGMSMGMRASMMLSEQLVSVFEGRQNKKQLVAHYQAAWSKAFSGRITAGYYLQNLFGKSTATDLALRFLNEFPLITKGLISLTHGERF